MSGFLMMLRTSASGSLICAAIEPQKFSPATTCTRWSGPAAEPPPVEHAAKPAPATTANRAPAARWRPSRRPILRMVLIPGNVPNRLRAAGRGGASVCPIWAMWSRRYDLRPVGNLAATEKPADTALHRAPTRTSSS